MSAYDPSQPVIRSAEIPSTELKGETVLLSLEQQSYFGLRSTSQRIWQLLEHPHTLQQLRDELLQEYAVDAQQCERELAVFMQGLWQARLIQPTGSGQAVQR
jgi:hypothetical protein